MPSSLLESVEISRGGASAIYGSNAVAGVVNINTFPQSDEDILRLSTSYGSFARRFATAKYLTSISDIKLLIAADYSASKGNYPYTILEYSKKQQKERTNADFENSVISLAAQYSNKKYSMSLINFFNSTHRGSPGAVIQGKLLNSKARLSEFQINSLANLKYNINDFQSLSLDLMS